MIHQHNYLHDFSEWQVHSLACPVLSTKLHFPVSGSWFCREGAFYPSTINHPCTSVSKDEEEGNADTPNNVDMHKYFIFISYCLTVNFLDDDRKETEDIKQA